MMRKLIGLLASCTALVSCGGVDGSSGGSVAVISAPSTTPTPTPTPIVTARTLNTGEVKPAAGVMFLSATMSLTTIGGVSQKNGVITGGMTTDRVTTAETPQFAISYGSETGYRLSDLNNSVTFGPAQLTGDDTAPNGNGTVLFTNVASSKEDYLALYQRTTYTSSLKGAGYTTARYGGIAGWQHTLVSGTTRQTRLDYFAYGTPTPLNSVPRSGMVQYTMLSAGNYATDNDLWFLGAGRSPDFVVNFSTGEFSDRLALVGQNFCKSQVGSVGSVLLRGTLNGNSASGAFTDGSLNTSGRVPGRFRLLLVGPNAEEVILTFIANDGAQAAVSASVGVQDPYAS